MSIDFKVYAASKTDLQGLESIFAEGRDLRVSRDGTDSSHFVIERFIRGKFSYCADFDGPFEVEREDLPDQVMARGLGVR